MVKTRLQPFDDRTYICPEIKWFRYLNIQFLNGHSIPILKDDLSTEHPVVMIPKAIGCTTADITQSISKPLSGGW
jgi:hypothetical protein